MKLRASTRLVFLLAVVAVCTTMLHATAISGSLPFASFGVSEMPGPNLETSTNFSATEDVTSGLGSGDFAAVPMNTSFGPFTLTDTEISTGGGFMISKSGVGTFVATGGQILNDTADSLTVNLTGVFDPEGSFSGLAPSTANVTLGFEQRHTSISASFSLETTGTPIPEPGTLVTMGMGLCSIALALRRKLRH